MTSIYISIYIYSLVTNDKFNMGDLFHVCRINKDSKHRLELQVASVLSEKPVLVIMHSFIHLLVISTGVSRKGACPCMGYKL